MPHVFIRIPCLAALSALALLQACSSQQLYGAGQEWQRNECMKISDFQERQRCVARTKSSYDQYKHDAEAARGAAK